MLAEITTSSATSLWIVGLLGACGALPGLVAVISLFATRREVQQLEKRLDQEVVALARRADQTEDLISKLRDDVHQMERRMNTSDEARAVQIHERINQVLGAVSQLRGELTQMQRTS